MPLATGRFKAERRNSGKAGLGAYNANCSLIFKRVCPEKRSRKPSYWFINTKSL